TVPRRDCQGSRGSPRPSDKDVSSLLQLFHRGAPARFANSVRLPRACDVESTAGRNRGESGVLRSKPFVSRHSPPHGTDAFGPARERPATRALTRAGVSFVTNFRAAIAQWLTQAHCQSRTLQNSGRWPRQFIPN